MNWKTSKTTLIGILLVAFATIQAAKAPSIKAAFTDPTTQVAVITAVLAKLAADQKKADS